MIMIIMKIIITITIVYHDNNSNNTNNNNNKGVSSAARDGDASQPRIWSLAASTTARSSAVILWMSTVSSLCRLP